MSSVFNPGATRLPDGRIGLIVRVQTRGRETVLMPATSDDGVAFSIEPAGVAIAGLDDLASTVHHLYDPRLTWVEDRLVMICAADVDDGCRLIVAVAEDDTLRRFRLLSIGEVDARNGVLFPERFDGRYRRLERPARARNAGVPSGDSIILAESDDLVAWRPIGTVMEGRRRSWDELIGSGPPPVRTSAGWLHIYHGVATHFQSVNIYQAGVVLLDLDDPCRVLARSRENLLEPREPWEVSGQVPNVVFPTGLVVDDLDANGCAPPQAGVRLYYGAADTVVALATTTIGALLEAART